MRRRPSRSPADRLLALAVVVLGVIAWLAARYVTESWLVLVAYVAACAACVEVWARRP